MKTRLLILILAVTAATLVSQTTPREQVGAGPDGGFLLNSGWRIKAQGTQIPVDTFPMASLVTPDKKMLLVLNGGWNPPSVSVIDIATAKELSRTPVPDGWLGLTMTRAGDKVYVGGGAKAVVYEFSFSGGVLKPARLFPVVAEKDRKDIDFIGDVQLAPDGHLLYAANLFRDSVAVINPQSGLVLSTIKTGRRPYRILFHPSGKSFYVSSWADGSIGQYDVAKGNRIANVSVAPHTTDMVWSDRPVTAPAEGADADRDGQPAPAARLFVSASNTNSVYVLGATESGELSRLGNINLALTSRQPLGTTPGGLGLSADGTKLFVACADANLAAVIDITQLRSPVLGFVPTGWYPTAAFGLPDGRMGVLNGRGLGSHTNPTGTVQFTDLADLSRLDGWSKEVSSNTPYRDEKLDDAGTPEGNPVRANGPIKHVIYIVRENRTYDQVLGDMKQGNGDASLATFGEKITPNLHKLASEFVLLDNFYVNAESSGEGHNWATAAIAPDYTQRMSPGQSAGRRKIYDFEGGEPANSPPAGFLWNAASQARLTVRNYGYFVDNRATPEPDGTQITGIRDPILAPLTDPNYRGFDPDYPDVERAKEFISELDDFSKSGTMPQLLIVRMGNDRTNGNTAGKLSPSALVADNDQGVGMLVEAVSKSRFWNETAIFIVEAATQNGPDHVDTHRAPAWVVSPWVKRGTVHSSLYNQASVLRTMEIILGLHPMTVYDAGARPMFGVFSNSVSPQPFALEKAQTPLGTRNPAL